MDFFDIPTTVWNISMMMSIYVVVLSTSTDLLTHSSTCFIFNHIYDVDLRTFSFFVLLRTTCKLYLYVILERIYDVYYLCNSMVLLRAFSFLFYVILGHM